MPDELKTRPVMDTVRPKSAECEFIYQAMHDAALRKRLRTEEWSSLWPNKVSGYSARPESGWMCMCCGCFGAVTSHLLTEEQALKAADLFEKMAIK